MTVSISIERHLAIGHPTTITPYKLLFWTPIVFSIAYNIPKFFELAACDVTESIIHPSDQEFGLSNTSLTSDEDNLTQYDQNENSKKLLPYNSSYVDTNDINETSYNCDLDGMRATPLRQNEWYIIFYVVVSKVILVEVVPWLTVVFLNIWTWRKMVVFQRKREAMLKRGKRGEKGVSIVI